MIIKKFKVTGRYYEPLIRMRLHILCRFVHPSFVHQALERVDIRCIYQFFWQIVPYLGSSVVESVFLQTSYSILWYMPDQVLFWDWKEQLRVALSYVSKCLYSLIILLLWTYALQISAQNLLRHQGLFLQICLQASVHINCNCEDMPLFCVKFQ